MLSASPRRMRKNGKKKDSKVSSHGHKLKVSVKQRNDNGNLQCPRIRTSTASCLQQTGGEALGLVGAPPSWTDRLGV